MIRSNNLVKLLSFNISKIHSLIQQSCKFTNKSTSSKQTSSNEDNSDQNERETVNFGFEKVRETEKQGKVNQVFDNVASKYDIMNDAMSFGKFRFILNLF